MEAHQRQHRFARGPAALARAKTGTPVDDPSPDGRFVDVGFTFDTRGVRGGGVHARRPSGMQRFADSFGGWLRRVHLHAAALDTLARP